MSIAKKFEVIADAVYEKGKKDEYDKFWDELQVKGNRVSYTCAFSFGWSFENFYPKYDIKPNGYCQQMFYGWSDSLTKTNYSLKKRLEECGVILDISKCTDLTAMFNWNPLITEIPTLDLTGTTSNGSMFAYCPGIITIEKLIVNENTPMTNFFGALNSSTTKNVENLVIEGVIGKSGFDCAVCIKLTKASLLSILTALSKDSSIASGKSITFSTVHQSVIEADADCLEQYNLAISAGWTIAYA